MNVGEVMVRHVELIDPEKTLLDAARLMRDRDIGALPIGENDRLVGMLTDRDIVVRAVAEGMDPQRETVRSCMTKGIEYCFEDEPIEATSHHMAEKKVRRLPVLNRDKRLVGIVSLGDLTVKASAGVASEAWQNVSQPIHR